MRCLYLIVVAACSASDDIPAPMISSVLPDRAATGTVVTVSGEFFCQRPDTGNEDPICDTPGEVQFGAAPGTITMWSDTAVMVEVPQGIVGDVSLDLVVNGRPSNAVAFTVEVF